jgi:hypothetical protein
MLGFNHSLENQCLFESARMGKQRFCVPGKKTYSYAIQIDRKVIMIGKIDKWRHGWILHVVVDKYLKKKTSLKQLNVYFAWSKNLYMIVFTFDEYFSIWIFDMNSVIFAT